MTEDSIDDANDANEFDYGEKQPDGQYENYPTTEEGEPVQPVRRKYVHDDDENGCGTVTRMSTSIARSVARDPEYYGKTFCADCGEHVPVSEVSWAVDGESWRIDIE